MLSQNLSRRVRTLACAFFLLPAFASGFAQSFTLYTTPTTVTIHPGDQDIPVAISASSNSVTSPITITVSGLPSGVTASPLTIIPGSRSTLYLSATVTAGRRGSTR